MSEQDEELLGRHRAVMAEKRRLIRERTERNRRVRDAAIDGDWDELDRFIDDELARGSSGTLGDGTGENETRGADDWDGINTPGTG